MTRHIFLDTETTGLSPRRGAQIWELALINGDRILEYQLPVDLTRADTMALRIGGFYARRPIPTLGINRGTVCAWRDGGADGKWQFGLTAKYFAAEVAAKLDGAHLVGANPAFDAMFIEAWLNKHGQAATWDHHLVDVEERVAALYGLSAGIGLRKSAELLGLEVDTEQTHTALYDAQLAKRVFERCLELAPLSAEDAA